MSTKKRIGNRVIPDGKIQVNFNSDEQLIKKIRFIANQDGLAYAEVYNLAFSKLIEAYEAKHGKIKLREPGSKLNNL